MIVAKSASLVYFDHGREIHACRDIDMQVSDNEFVGILGPSGSGKSSLLYLLSGLKNSTSGDVSFRGQSYKSLSDQERSNLRLREFGFVFQQPYLVGYLTALENVLLVDNSSSDSVTRAESLLDSLGLGDRMNRMPSELSGGEKQRVCVARAIMSSPSVVFADEPTASLDHSGGLAVVSLLRQHHRGAVVMVTHDPSMLEDADRIFTIAEGVASPVHSK
ncbi:MAG: ATP-binding cassette domain-containing protein [Fimbriimonadales bacterium]|nr:ATP-binding cassette domain-containing protein [Fimbriimonadales bacterium]